MYDSVQLVQNSGALKGSQRVLLDQVISEEQCAELRHLAHVRTLHIVNKSICRCYSMPLQILNSHVTDNQ